MNDFKMLGDGTGYLVNVWTDLSDQCGDFTAGTFTAPVTEVYPLVVTIPSKETPC